MQKKLTPVPVFSCLLNLLKATFDKEVSFWNGLQPKPCEKLLDQLLIHVVIELTFLFYKISLIQCTFLVSAVKLDTDHV